MQQQLKDVEHFHKTFKRPVAYKPTLIPSQNFALRYELMKEENNEYLQACADGNLVEIADALGDKLYILCGTIIEHGMQHLIEDVFAEIQRSNMSKLDENGQPIIREDGKILKSNLYKKPDIKSILYPTGESEDNNLPNV